MALPTNAISQSIIDLGMSAAIAQARSAFARNEVPVGAAVYDCDSQRIIAEAGNQVEELRDATAHAETLAIRAASSVLSAWRLENCALFVTLEPCTMCIGAIRNARVGALVFGSTDARAGAVGSLYDLALDERLGRTPRVVSGERADECSLLLKQFFANRR